MSEAHVHHESRRLTLTLKNFLLTGIVGWIVSLYTLWHRAKVQAGVDLGASFCNINDKINCDSVALSSYSNIGGIAISTFGLLFFAFVILLALRALKQQREHVVGDTTRKLFLLMGFSGIFTSIALFILSMTRIGAFCLVCGIVYLLCFSLAHLAWKSSKLILEKGSRAERVEWGFIFIVISALALQFAFQPLADFAANNGTATDEESLPAEMLSQVQSEFNAGSAYEIPDQSSPSVGSSTAKVTLVEFSDFQCPHCAQNHKNMPLTVAPFGEKVRIVYKNFPLDPACNSGGMHRQACYAAQAARCVYKKTNLDAFKLMQDYLFENQDTLNPEKIKERAVALGMSESDFKNCVDSPEIKEEIKAEIDLGKSLGVEGTPSIYLNGKLLKLGANTAVLKVMLKQLLK